MVDLAAAYSAGQAAALDATGWPSPVIRARLADELLAVETNAWLMGSYPVLVERQFGMVDGLTEILRRRRWPGTVDIPPGRMVRDG